MVSLSLIVQELVPHAILSKHVEARLAKQQRTQYKTLSSIVLEVGNDDVHTLAFLALTSIVRERLDIAKIVPRNEVDFRNYL